MMSFPRLLSHTKRSLSCYLVLLSLKFSFLFSCDFCSGSLHSCPWVVQSTFKILTLFLLVSRFVYCLLSPLLPPSLLVPILPPLPSLPLPAFSISHAHKKHRLTFHLYCDYQRVISRFLRFTFHFFYLFSFFQRRDVYGAWEQYLGLEHSDNAPKRAYAVNQVKSSSMLSNTISIPKSKLCINTI